MTRECLKIVGKDPSDNDRLTIMVIGLMSTSKQDLRRLVGATPGAAQDCARVCETEAIPSDWKKGIILPLYKGKSDRSECKNHRGITEWLHPGSVDCRQGPRPKHPSPEEERIPATTLRGLCRLAGSV